MATLTLLIGASAGAKAPLPEFPPETERFMAPWTGCMLIKAVGGTEVRVFNPEQCKLAWVPCSTFKIANSLIALETGAMSSTSDVIPWDGKPRYLKAWEKDHSLASGIKVSAVPVFQEVARRIGLKRMQKWVKKLAYGNGTIGKVIDRFWLDGPLKTTAWQQLDFMERLYRDLLPLKKATMAAVRKILVLDSSPTRTVSGKTGSDLEGDSMVFGWFVGHLQKGAHQYVYVINLRGKNASGAKARAAADAILRGMEL